MFGSREDDPVSVLVGMFLVFMAERCLKKGSAQETQ